MTPTDHVEKAVKGFALVLDSLTDRTANQSTYDQVITSMEEVAKQFGVNVKFFLWAVQYELPSRGCKMKVGEEVQRTPLARRILHDPDYTDVGMIGVYAGKARGRFAGCILVRVGSAKKAEPFQAELWEPISRPANGVTGRGAPAEGKSKRRTIADSDKKDKRRNGLRLHGAYFTLPGK